MAHAPSFVAQVVNPAVDCFVLPSIHVTAGRSDFVGQVGNLRPIGGALWAGPSGITYKCQHRLRLAPMSGSQSWLQPAFSRLLCQRVGQSLPQEMLLERISHAVNLAVVALTTVRKEKPDSRHWNP